VTSSVLNFVTRSGIVVHSKVVLSPGPGNPSDFGLSNTIDVLIKHKIPAFGVCLGLQGMVEHFGGTLGVLGYPMHGKPSLIHLTPEGKAPNRYEGFAFTRQNVFRNQANSLDLLLSASLQTYLTHSK
jgi:anthranilate/para-aminobenzoate synthase component II